MLRSLVGSEMCIRDSVNRLSELMDKKALVENFLKEVQLEVMRRLMGGEEIPGYRLIRGRANRKFIESAESILSELLDEEAYERKLIGITKAQKLLGPAQMAELTIKPPGQPKLVTAEYVLSRGEEEFQGADFDYLGD